MTAHRIRLRVNAHQARTLARWCEAARLAWNLALDEGDRQLRDRRGGRGFVRRRGRRIPVGLDWAPNPDALLEDLSRLLTRVRRVARLWWMVPKLGWLRLEERLRWRGRVKTARISVEAGAWYVSLGMEWDHVRGPAPDVRPASTPV